MKACFRGAMFIFPLDVIGRLSSVTEAHPRHVLYFKRTSCMPNIE